MPTTSSSSLGQQRAARAAKLGALLVAAVAAVVLLVRWLVRRTWRRLFPLYWAAAGLGLAWLSGPMGVSAGTVGLVVAIALAAAALWPARSWAVRGWRAGIVLVLGGSAVATTAAGGPAAMAAHPTLAVFVPTLSAVLLGWPWWHHLRQAAPPAEVQVQAQPARPQADPVTADWAARWEHKVIGAGVCAGTRLVHAVTPREGVTEVVLQLLPGRGMKPAAIVKKGPEVEVALDLPEGGVGFQATGKASRVRCTLTERSYVAGGVAWTGPTYRNGRCQILTYVDGSVGWWTSNPPKFGVKGGLVVGSSGAGKTRALGALIASHLHAGWMVVVGDSQNGQSLPAWRTKTEYHAGVDDVIVLIRRLHAEIMHRSKLLADAGVEVFDEDDPRVQALGLKKMLAVIDECQLPLVPNTPIVKLATESAETMRKTGVGIILATQLPQMGSLGGSIRLRDALVGGNVLALRLSNRGSGTAILPDDFVGDPFAIQPEDEKGNTTAGMGYLRATTKIGMIGRTPMLDESTVAAGCPDVKVVWTVPPIDPATPINPRPGTVGGDTGGEGRVAKLRAMFGGGKAQPAPAAPASSADWVMACLGKGPTSAQGLLDRPDCPVKSAQLYALLDALSKTGQILPPATRGGGYSIPARATATAPR